MMAGMKRLSEEVKQLKTKREGDKERKKGKKKQRG
jgi:hypothetical protein